jgi:hypothetical protein
MSEHDEQVAVFDVLRANERKYPFLKWIYAIPNGGHRHPAVAGKMKAEGVKAGVSDICVPIPMTTLRKHGAYFEMKFGKNKLTAEQLAFADFVRSQAYYFETVWTADECLIGIEMYLGIKLSR